MISKDLLLYEYEQVLIGNRSGFSPYYFKYGENTSMNYALQIIRFAVEEFLKWSPYDVRDHFTKEIAEQMKVEPLMKYIEFPDELDKNTDYFYIATLLYPNVIRYDEKELILKTYEKVMKGTLNKFPKEYFAGTRGVMRAGICLQYMINHNFAFNSVREMYAFFGGPDSLKCLRKHRLAALCKEMFDEPIDFLHEALPTNQKDDYYFQYYKFLLLNQRQISVIRKAELARKRALKAQKKKEAEILSKQKKEP